MRKRETFHKVKLYASFKYFKIRVWIRTQAIFLLNLEVQWYLSFFISDSLSPIPIDSFKKIKISLFKYQFVTENPFVVDKVYLYLKQRDIMDYLPLIVGGLMAVVNILL